jgi:hypothetical protein
MMNFPLPAEKNGGRGLKGWSEENLEKCHKICRCVKRFHYAIYDKCWSEIFYTI